MKVNIVVFGRCEVVKEELLEFFMDYLVSLYFLLNQSLVFEMRNNRSIEELILADVCLILEIEVHYFLRLRLYYFLYLFNALNLVVNSMMYLELWVVNLVLIAKVYPTLNL